MALKRALVHLVSISIRNIITSRPVTGLYCFRSPIIRSAVANSKADKLALKGPEIVYKIAATPILCLTYYEAKGRYRVPSQSSVVRAPTEASYERTR